MRVTFWAVCLSTVAMGQQIVAQTVVVPNEHIRLLDSSPHSFTIHMEIGTNSLAFATFSYSGHSIDLEIPSADHQYYQIMRFGDVFNPLDDRVFGGILRDGLGEVGSDDFYLGIWLPIGGFQNFRSFGQRYGWVHLRPVDGVLTMVSNVMSYNSRGIVVGTTQVVPEPSSALMAICGALGLLSCRTGMSSQIGVS